MRFSVFALLLEWTGTKPGKNIVLKLVDFPLALLSGNGIAASVCSDSSARYCSTS